MLRLILVLAVLGLASAITPFALADGATTQKPKTDVSAPAEPAEDDEDTDTGKADADEAESPDDEEAPADDSESDD